MATLTPNQKLAEVLLGRPLQTYVLEKRTARPRWSWALIAEELALDTAGQVDISPQAIRAMYADDEAFTEKAS